MSEQLWNRIGVFCEYRDEREISGLRNGYTRDGMLPLNLSLTDVQDYELIPSAVFKIVSSRKFCMQSCAQCHKSGISIVQNVILHSMSTVHTSFSLKPYPPLLKLPSILLIIAQTQPPPSPKLNANGPTSNHSSKEAPVEGDLLLDLLKGLFEALYFLVFIIDGIIL